MPATDLQGIQQTCVCAGMFQYEEKNDSKSQLIIAAG